MKKKQVGIYLFPNSQPELYNSKIDYGSRPETTKGTSCHILLEAIWPIFKLAQGIGIAPMQLRKNISNNKMVGPDPISNVEDCPKMVSEWVSFPSAINAFMTVHLMWVTCWVLINIKSLLSTTFKGTDLYTFCIEIQLYFVQTTIILMNSFWKRKKLPKLWKLLHNVYRCLNSLEYGNSPLILNGCTGRGTLILNKYLKRLKFVNCVLVVVILIMGSTYAAYFLNFVFQQCFISESDRILLGDLKPMCFWDSWPLLIEKMTYTVVEMYHQGIGLLFCSICSIVWAMHKEIGKRLKLVLKATNKDCRSVEIERLRICHENLSKCGRVIGDFFGVAILAACVLSVVSFTSSIYTILLGSTDMGATGIVSPGYLQQYLIIWVFHGVFGLIALALILIPGQMVQNAAEIPFQIIGSVSHEDLNAAEKYQITAFMSQKRSFSGITACNVSTVGLSFYATAATNVTTYMLVLLQFRLGVDKA